MTLSSPKRPAPLALALGVLGGGALVATTQLTTVGPAIYLPYTAFVLGSLVAVRLAGWGAFRDRFSAAFLAFMTATAAFYVFIVTVATGTLSTTPVWGHVAVLGLMAGIGGALSAAVAYVADFGRAHGAS